MAAQLLGAQIFCCAFRTPHRKDNTMPIQRIEEWRDGQLLNVTEIEYPDPPPAPLDPTGALATLLAVVALLTVEDAANAVGLTPDDLTAEAQAWAAAGDAG